MSFKNGYLVVKSKDMSNISNNHLQTKLIKLDISQDQSQVTLLNFWNNQWYKKVKCFECLSTGELEADQGVDQAREAGGAPKAHAGDAPALETEAGDHKADPGGFTV